MGTYDIDTFPLTLDDFTANLAEVRAQEIRADGKAFSLLAFSGAALGAVGAGLLTGKAHGIALGTGLAVAALLGGSLVLLGHAIWPRLKGDFGFVAWARAGSPEALARLLIKQKADEVTAAAACVALHTLSRGVRAKYRATRRAMLLLAGALATGVLGLIVTAIIEAV